MPSSLQWSRRHRSWIASTALCAAVFGLSACQTEQQAVAEHEDSLAAAGFIVRPANTPERIAMLKRLPAHRFVQRVKGDQVHYVYADPLVCGCLYVGTQQAYNTYKRDRMQQQLADEQQMTAQMYSDPAWSWGAWGMGTGMGMGMGYGAEGGW